jgi:hypothetical protein
VPASKGDDARFSEPDPGVQPKPRVSPGSWLGWVHPCR